MWLICDIWGHKEWFHCVCQTFRDSNTWPGVQHTSPCLGETGCWIPMSFLLANCASWSKALAPLLTSCSHSSGLPCFCCFTRKFYEFRCLPKKCPGPGEGSSAPLCFWGWRLQRCSTERRARALACEKERGPWPVLCDLVCYLHTTCLAQLV